MSESTAEHGLFTCLSCSIAFHSAEDQRIHYRSDHHRYNMKRRVASLPPVSAMVFNQKVLERRSGTAVTSSAKRSTCDICNRDYATENAYKSHIMSKKHREQELKVANTVVKTVAGEITTTSPPASSTLSTTQNEQDEAVQPTVVSLPENDSDGEINQLIDQKIAAARSRLSPAHCLFCTQEFSSLEDNLTHMSTAHSFFIPDAEFLVDISGLISYLGEKIAVGNVCTYCNKEFRTLEAVRKHLVDKSHCKIAYDTENDRLELSDFYDFTTSYPDTQLRSHKTIEKQAGDDDAGEWEEIENDSDEVDEIVDDVSDESGEASETDSLPGEHITYGDSHFELVLPSGARIGHRSMRRYYAQSFRVASRVEAEGIPSGAALVRRLLRDKNSALVPRGGGFGAFGNGTEVVKARNRGEAREAGRHVREFRDQRRRENFRTKVGFIHNSQKHFRDPLLQ